MEINQFINALNIILYYLAKHEGVLFYRMPSILIQHLTTLKQVDKKGFFSERVRLKDEG